MPRKIHVPRYEGEIPGLPDKAIVITNSERSLLPCALKWWYAKSEQLKTRVSAKPLRYGSLWHLFIEDLHKWFAAYDSEYPEGAEEDSCAWCRGTGGMTSITDLKTYACKTCDGTGKGPLYRAAMSQYQFIGDENGFETEEECEKLIETLRRAASGYFKMYSRQPSPKYKVVASEKSFAIPILQPDGKPYCPTTWLTETSYGLRLARTGEANLDTAIAVRWPWYQCMTLDAILQHRETGGLIVWEGKTSKSPQQKVLNLGVDPQLTGYCWGLQKAINLGLLMPKIMSDARVEGYLYDVVSNQYQPDPVLLKPRKVQMTSAGGSPLYHQTKANGGGLGVKQTSRKA